MKVEKFKNPEKVRLGDIFDSTLQSLEGHQDATKMKPDGIFKGDFGLARRWLLSGGDITVFGHCQTNHCPKKNGTHPYTK